MRLIPLTLLAAALYCRPAPSQTPIQTPATPPTPVLLGDPAPNTRAAQKKHYVVLVSLDGFRYDYPTKWSAPNIAALQLAGATAPQGMLPSYPSLTFPNHIALVTGLVPQHSGIVANTFYDPTRNATYSYKNDQTNSDGTWYTGTPLWSLAEQQGMRAASFFWPGSEASIAGHRPAFYTHFNDKADDEARIAQLITWLQLPPAQRPHLLTLYYSNTDHAGHDFGPDSPEEQAAVAHVDTLIGHLKARLDATHLPIDLIVLADHGMIHSQGDWITLDQFADLSAFKSEGTLLYPPDDAAAALAYADFLAHPDPRFSVYRRADVPAPLTFNQNPREGDPVIVPNGPYQFRAHTPKPSPDGKAPRKPSLGEHGYDPARIPEMKALFLAIGPDIRPHTQLPTFQNVDIYDLICHLLQLTPAPNDGTLTPLLPALKHP